MSINTSRGHLMRALLEASCLKSAEIARKMSTEYGEKIESTFVHGDLSYSNIIMQVQSDFIGCYIVRKKEKEIAAIGAAIAAGLQVGFWKSIDEIDTHFKVEKLFSPSMSEERREKKMKKWTVATYGANDILD